MREEKPVYIFFWNFSFHEQYHATSPPPPPCFVQPNAGNMFKPISGRVDRASATEAVDLASIPGRVKPKTRKIGIHSFPA